MRIVLTWQPEDAPGPQTVYVEDPSPATVATFEAAFAVRHEAPDGVIELPNVALSDGDRNRSSYIFRVGRLISYEVQR